MHCIATVEEKAALSLYFVWILNKTSASPICSGVLDKENGSLRTGPSLYGVSQYLVIKKLWTCLKKQICHSGRSSKKVHSTLFPSWHLVKKKSSSRKKFQIAKQKEEKLTFEQISPLIVPVSNECRLKAGGHFRRPTMNSALLLK